MAKVCLKCKKKIPLLSKISLCDECYKSSFPLLLSGDIEIEIGNLMVFFGEGYEYYKKELAKTNIKDYGKIWIGSAIQSLFSFMVQASKLNWGNSALDLFKKPTSVTINNFLRLGLTFLLVLFTNSKHSKQIKSTYEKVKLFETEVLDFFKFGDEYTNYYYNQKQNMQADPAKYLQSFGNIFYIQFLKAAEVEINIEEDKKEIMLSSMAIGEAFRNTFDGLIKRINKKHNIQYMIDFLHEKKDEINGI
ncbi:hypothetical protein ACFLQQ_04345 [Actinomycetota bacterium]